jgi:uncharacterized protein
MFARFLKKELLESAKFYPTITLLGPRQSGKTTLVREIFADKPYVNLESPDLRELAHADPRAFLAGLPEGAILDEIQRAPFLLSYIQPLVDEKEQMGMFVLTGSHQLELHQAISQSLAGRTAILKLLPMSLAELAAANIENALDDALLLGGYPRIYKDQLNPTKAYRNYFETYIERDLRQLILVKDLLQFQKFVRLCAGRIGQLLNLDSLGNEVGVSSHTIKEWISILEASFVLFRLAPYYENFGKRIIKSPKLYFTDVGLASYLLGIENTTQMARDPLRGNLIENLVILELMKMRLNQGLDPQLYFFRDVQGHEVDIIHQTGHELIPIEIKASQTFNKDFLKNLTFFQKVAQERCSKGYLIYSGEQEQSIGSFELLNYLHASRIMNMNF